MRKLHVEDMHCMNCQKRISALFEEEGLKFEIDLENKTVSVEENKAEQAIELLEELGFSAK